MQPLPIGEVSRLSGMAPSAIRYYEEEGLVSRPERSGGGWRAFDPGVVERLKVIRLARELGFSLEDIRTLLNGFSPDTPPPERWQELATRKLPEIQAFVDRATAMKRLLEKGLRCDCVSIQECFLYDCNPPVALKRRST
jgi:MerR family redox-sensitive transcriptional activator SoxR